MSKLKILTEEYINENRKGKAVISYSQFSMYNQCPHRWYKNYIEGIKTFDYSIHLLFGTAVHETLQEYITILYEKGGKEADSMDLNKLLLSRMKTVFASATEQGYTDFTTQEQMGEFYSDGIAILDHIKKKRKDYFGIRGYELAGIEIPLFTQLFDDIPHVMMLGYLDVVIKDTILNKYKIIDIKTSTKGWNKYQKADEGKTAQLKIYKRYFAKQYDVDEDDINVEFFIVKRKLYENCDFPQKRVQSFTPSETNKAGKKLMEDLRVFVTNAFDENGDKNVDGSFPKNVSDKSCKWCEFNTKDKKHCDRKKRK